MNSFKNSLFDNTLAINKNLTTLNKLYKERIEILEKKLSNEEMDSNNDNVHTDNYDDFFHKLKHFNTESEKDSITILSEIDLPIENTNDDKDTSLRISKETKKALEEVRFDFIDHYREKMSYSQAIYVLIEIYINQKLETK